MLFFPFQSVYLIRTKYSIKYFILSACECSLALYSNAEFSATEEELSADGTFSAHASPSSSQIDFVNMYIYAHTLDEGDTRAREPISCYCMIYNIMYVVIRERDEFRNHFHISATYARVYYCVYLNDIAP